MGFYELGVPKAEISGESTGRPTFDKGPPCWFMSEFDQNSTRISNFESSSYVLDTLFSL